MLKICLVFWESEPQYAYKRYAYKKKRSPQAAHVPCRQIWVEVIFLNSDSWKQDKKKHLKCY